MAQSQNPKCATCLLRSSKKPKIGAGGPPSLSCLVFYARFFYRARSVPHSQAARYCAVIFIPRYPCSPRQSFLCGVSALRLPDRCRRSKRSPRGNVAPFPLSPFTRETTGRNLRDVFCQYIFVSTFLSVRIRYLALPRRVPLVFTVPSA